MRNFSPLSSSRWRSAARVALAGSALCGASLTGCGGDGDGGGGVDMEVSAGGAGGAGGGGGAGGAGGDLPPVSREAVSGHLTYAGAGGHLYSLEVTGGLRQRLTAEPGPWRWHAVSPDGRQIVAVREAGPTDHSVWVIDVRDQTTTRVSPPGCDAGLGGVGWTNDAQVMFAAACDGQPSVGYLASASGGNDSADDLLPLTDHEQPVRDLFPATRTPLFTYVLDVVSCSGNTCVTKPEVWIGESNGGRCRLTDGDRDLVTGAARLGDHHPTFAAALDAVVFSRNVGDKPAGPDGHFDLMRVGFDVQALLRGDPVCAVGGVTNLSTTLLASERYPDGAGGEVVGSERDAAAAAGRGPEGSILFTGEASGTEPVTGVWVIDPAGNRTALTPDDPVAAHPSWIIPAYSPVF